MKTAEGMSVREAATRLKVSRVIVYRWVRQGRIRIAQNEAQARREGRFGPGGMVLDPGDVEREAARRGV